jgi:hypothetical protein
MKLKNRIKYFINDFDYLRAYFSPFKPLRLKWYCGKIAIGTPYFFPRVWKKNKDKPGYLTPIPKKIGFDFVPLGWKTKYDDYRFEWSPRISFVFFKWQIAVTFVAPHADHYWESWLYYTRDTKGTTRQRIKQCRKEAPQIWTTTESYGTKTRIDYYDKILKKRWLK